MYIVCLLSLWFSFSGRFFGAYWHFVLLWKLSANLLHCFTAKWETKLWYQGQLNHPTPIGWRKNYYVVFYPVCLGRPCIRRSFRLWKERGYDILSFYLRYFVIFQWLLHKNIITQTSLHLNIHSLLRMLQYLWHGRVCISSSLYYNRLHDTTKPLYRHVYRYRHQIIIMNKIECEHIIRIFSMFISVICFRYMYIRGEEVYD